MEKIIAAVEKLIKSKPDAIIAIDGPCASGKTTVAAHLAQKFNAGVIHTDDFFLPPEMRRSERLAQPGGNIHYERFNAEIAKGIESGKAFDYGIYSCSSGKTYRSSPVLPGKPIVIEGSYALHPEIKIIYDLKIYIEADYETRLERILLRNGAEALETFKAKWIPLEDNYFRQFYIRQSCDIITKTDRKA